MSGLMFKTLKYWEFYYRKNVNDNGGLFLTFDKKEIPSCVQNYAVERCLKVPFEVWAEKGFDPTVYTQTLKNI